MFVEGGKTETKADVFSLESLIAWLERQEPKAEYFWNDGTACLLGQWLRTIDPAVDCNFGPASGYNIYSYIVNGQQVDLARFKPVARGESEWDTFGAALERARKLL